MASYLQKAQAKTALTKDNHASQKEVSRRRCSRAARRVERGEWKVEVEVAMVSL